MSQVQEQQQKSICSVVLVGCGFPLRSMGWYHAMQILDERIPGAILQHVVEPWYMQDGASKGCPGYNEFHEWRKSLLKEQDVAFYSNVTDVPKKEENDGNGNTVKRLCIISARTADNPKLFADCLTIGCDAIFLEKPGAPTVAELEQMQTDAKSQNIPVYMGFNKNVSSYLVQSREFAVSQQQPCRITFWHNNNYNESELPECFERNAEGMLKNMAIHELALLVTYYGVKVDTIDRVIADKEFSECQTFQGPSSGKKFTDFNKLKFEIITKDGISVNVAADRCGGDDSVAIVTANDDNTELARYTMPDKATIDNIPLLQSKYGNEAMPYFFAQDPDYCKLKQLVVNHLLHGFALDGVATINVAAETLKVAEYLTPLLQEQLL
mmetsp:Transcript_12531/g.18399  ORF Transcript_12531/g.18399 Transcript_12531/m.18399 type:complete len:382 (+) Transcript_12531:34-1179(+)